MTIRMWDLAGAEDERRFSPYCWRIRMALAHKGLEVETLPWRFTEKDALAFCGQSTVPVIVDGGKAVHDSWSIAEYLDAAYPDRPALFAGEESRALAYFFKFWCERTVHAAIMRVILVDLYASLHPKDQPYFRESREKRLGTTLEAFGADRNAALATLRGSLDAVRAALVLRPFMSGAAPAFADYILFGAFQWARAVSPIRLLEPDDPVYAWRERMLDLHGGLARLACGYPVWA